MRCNPMRPANDRRRLVIALACAWLVACAGSGGSLSDLLASASGEGNVVSGLKQALEVGTRNAVDLTSRRCCSRCSASSPGRRERCYSTRA